MKGFIRVLRVLGGLIVAAAVVFMIIYFIRHSKPVIYDLRAYLEYTVSGYDGEAAMDVSVNKNNLAEDILPQLKKKNHNAYEELVAAISSGQSGAFIDGLFSMDVSRTEDLSNGDDVTVTFTYDNASLADYGIEFTGEREVIPVSGLEEIKEIDLFEGLTLDFAGISPYLTTDERVFFQTGDAYAAYTVSPADHLQSGSQVTAAIDLSESELPEGTRPKETEKTFVVSEADAFIMQAEELDEKDLERIRSQCEKTVRKEHPEARNLQILSGSTLYTDDGTLDGTAVIEDETPNLLAVYYQYEEADAGDEEADAATDWQTSDGSASEELANADGEYSGEETADTQQERQPVYGVVFIGHMVRTMEDNLTFRMIDGGADSCTARVFSSPETLKAAVSEEAEKLPGNMRVASEIK